MSQFYDLLRRRQGDNSVDGEPAASAERTDDQTSENNALAEMSSSLFKVLSTESQNGEDSPETIALRKELETRCVRTTWSADPSRRLLSNNGSLYSPGREEFRTLRAQIGRAHV